MRMTIAAVALAALFASSAAQADATKDCQIGSYRLTDGSVIDIAPSDGDTLRWRAFTGETGQLRQKKDGSWTSTYGWTNRPDGKTVAFSDCAKGDMTFGKESGQKIAFDVSDATFDSHGTKLVGRLVMPKGSGKVPVVVLIHGSEHDSARDFYALQ